MTEPHDQPKICSKCGASLKRGTLEALCPRCLLAAGLISNDSVETLTAAHSLPGVPEQPMPESIGRYKIVRLIGQGGMGRVYEAEQHQPRRTVALKLIKPGTVSLSLLRRFEMEAEALGRLQHPGIAQIYEAGTSDTGLGPQPYLAMEFIRGVSLKRYAQTHELKTRQRLELIAKVCDAVHHAHQRGIIHRDLKPANILVDETGQPKVLDFGVARVLDSDTQGTSQTDVGQLIGTLSYMSPEQAQADTLEIDTRSDVYALGMILYELLAGKLPYTLSSRLLETIRIIREQEPHPLSASGAEYRGDIETIAAKALEKDKARRYASAAEMAADIRRYLNDEPISARPPSAVYQLEKFARRNRGLVFGAASVLAVLIAGVVVSSIEARRARTSARNALSAEAAAIANAKRATDNAKRATDAEQKALQSEAQALRERALAVSQEQRADREAASSIAISDFLSNDVLAQAGAEAQAQPGTLPNPDMKVREALDKAAAKISGRFDKQPLVEASLRKTLGDAYNDLGLFEQARAQYERELEIRRSQQGRQHAETIRAMKDVAAALIDSEKWDEGGRAFSEAMDMARRTLGEKAETTLRLGLLQFSIFSKDRLYKEEEALADRIYKTSREALGPEHAVTLTAMNDLGVAYSMLGKIKPAVDLLEQVVQIRTRKFGEGYPAVLTNMNTLADLYQLQNKPKEWERLTLKVLETSIRVHGQEHPSTLDARSYAANMYIRQGKRQEAFSEAQLLLATSRRVNGEDSLLTSYYWLLLGKVNDHWDLTEEAANCYRKAIEIRRKILGPEHSSTLDAEEKLAVTYDSLGQLDRWMNALEDIYRAKMRTLGPTHMNLLSTETSLGRALCMQSQRYGEAVDLLRKSIEGLTAYTSYGEGKAVRSTARINLLYCYARMGNRTEAEAEARSLLSDFQARKPNLGEQYFAALIADLQMQAGKIADAEPMFKEACDVPVKAPLFDWQSQYCQSLKGALLAEKRSFEEAEKLLVAAHKGIRDAGESSDAETQIRLIDSAERIARLYREWDKPGLAAAWNEEARKLREMKVSDLKEMIRAKPELPVRL